MNVNQGLVIEQKQKLSMTPQLYQALEILQLSLPDLVHYLHKELNENPILEMQDSQPQQMDEELFSAIQRERDLFRRETAASTFEAEDTNPAAEGVWHDQENLQDYLTEQLRLYKDTWKLSNTQFYLSQFLIGNLDQNGYLAVELKEVAESLKVPLINLDEALAIVQKLDPPGIGARDLKECLALQFHLLPEQPSQMMEFLEYLDDVALGYWNKIADSLKISVEQVRKMTEMIKTLDPKPGSRFGSRNDIEYIIPDIIIQKIGEEFHIQINEKYVPRLYVNEGYRKILLERKDEDTREYIKKKTLSALNLIKSIEQRRSTIYRIMSVVVQKQNHFLEKGFACLKPLTMKQVAQELQIHESTVSRAMRNKYIQAPFGTISAKMLFSSSVDSSGENTPDRIKRLLKQFVSEENPCKPLSDMELAKRFQTAGISISRRTIAKYRDEMGIPSTIKRRKQENSK